MMMVMIQNSHRGSADDNDDTYPDDDDAPHDKQEQSVKWHETYETPEVYVRHVVTFC